MRHRLRHQLVISPVNSPFLAGSRYASFKNNPSNQLKSSSNQRLVIGLVIEFLEGKLVNDDECDECDDSYTNTIH